MHEDTATRQFHVVGVKDPKKLEQEISSLCATGLHRVIRPENWTERINGHAVVAVRIPEGNASEKPIFVSSRGVANGSFRRIGSTDRRCAEDDLRTLLQLADLKPYEDAVLSDASLDDLG